MNKYVVPVAIGLMAVGMSAIKAEVNPFDVDRITLTVSDSAPEATAPEYKSELASTSSSEVITGIVDITTNRNITLEELESLYSTKGFPVKGSIQGDNLRLREWPWGPVMGLYNPGDDVQVLAISGEFYKVSINGKIGYMHKNYVSIPGAKASEEAPYYPGNTAYGGYISKEQGAAQSLAMATGSNNTPVVKSTPVSFKSSVSNTKAESTALANYKGGKLSPKEFISLFGPVARESMKNTGIPASVTLAQAILETGWGKSSIGNAKNLFGIKGKGPAGSTNVATKEYYNGKCVTIKDGFRKYNSWQESIDDHANLLLTSRYSKALNEFKKTHNADKYAEGIHKAGYATSPTYAKNLKNLMKQYNLYEWDV